MPLAIVRFVAKRLFSNRALISSTAIGLLVTVTLATSVPLYAEGISGLLLQRELRKPIPQAQPSSSIFIRHKETNPATPTNTGDYLAYDQFFRSLIPEAVGLPTTQLISYLSTGRRGMLDLSPPEGADLSAPPRRFGFAFLYSINDFFDNVIVSEGRRPTAETSTFIGPAGARMPLLEGALTSNALDKLGLLVGDVVGMQFADPATGDPVVIAVRVVARVIPRDVESNYWPYPVRAAFDEGGVYIERAAYLGTLLDHAPAAFSEATWYADFDIDAIRATNIRRITGGLVVIRINANAVWEGTRLENSPEPIFFDFEQKLFFLTLLLLILSAPIVALTLYYIILTSGMVVDRQRNEIAILKSRGVGTLQIVGIYVLEGALIGGIATGAGPFLGSLMAQVIGKTFTFLVFTNRDPLPIDITTRHFVWAGAAAGLAIVATLLPAIGAARHSIVTYKQEVSRSTDRPWFQRFFVDVIVVVGAAYGYFTLRQRDQLVTVGEGGDLFSDPLLVIIPIMFMFAITLLFLRFFPWLVASLAFLGNRFLGVSMHLGLRQIAREPRQFTRLIFLLVLTLAIGSFSASMAATLDRNFDDRVYYSVGSQADFLEIGDYDEETQEWSFLPVERHLEVPQILRVARLWENEDTGFRRPGESLRVPIKTYGVDPLDFAQTVWWRDDFSPWPLNSLMNQLALDEQALIASREKFQGELGLGLGDPLRIDFGSPQTLEFFIAGWTDMFPTHYPEDGPFVVVNLDYVERSLGQTPWTVLAHIDPDVHALELRETLLFKRFKPLDARDARAEIAAARDDATRVGIFGILSIGFLIAAVLTIMGFLMYSYMSFRRRMQQLGILRAMGLSVRQLVGIYAFENGFLILLGVVLGTVLGVLTGNLFIPFLQLSVDRFGDTPPFVIITAWGDVLKIYILFGAVVAVAFPVSAWLLSKIRINEAVKFGEEQG